MAAEASFTLRAIDATKAAFASVQNSLQKLKTESSAASSFMKKAFDGKQIGAALATALGINLQSISENIARYITGQSVETQKLQEELVSLGDEAINSAMALARARNSDEQNLKALIIAQERLNLLVSKPASDLQGQVNAKKAEIALNQTNLQILTLTKKIEEDRNKAFEEMMAARIKTLHEVLKASEDAFDAMLSAQQKLNAEYKANKDKEIAERKSRQSIADSYKSLIDPLFELKKQRKEIQDLADDGLLTEDQYNEAIKMVIATYDQAIESQRTYVDSLGMTYEETERLKKSLGELQMINDAGSIIAQGFEDAILSGEKLQDVIKGIGRDLLRMVFQQSITQPLAAGISGALQGMFRANGGPVSSGSPYIVGERGPELFVPRASGSIVSNSNMNQGGGSSGSSINVNYNIAAGVTRNELAPILEQERRRLKAEIPDMVRRGGAYRSAFA
jgi:hypothetical protein